jgi:hypothetical protein
MVADVEQLCTKIAEIARDGGDIEEVLRTVLEDARGSTADTVRRARAWSAAHESVDERWREVTRLLRLCESTGLFRSPLRDAV